MSETDILQVGEPLPRIGTVDAGKDFTVRVTWLGSGPDVRLIDLAPAIFTYKIYRPLRDNPDLFRTVHVINSGDAIAWGANDEVDMSSTMLEHLASESMVHADFRAFMERNKLTLDAAAAQLGISRRLAAYFAAGDKPIPRYIALACAYLDGKPEGRGEPAGIRDESDELRAALISHASAWKNDKLRTLLISTVEKEIESGWVLLNWLGSARTEQK